MFSYLHELTMKQVIRHSWVCPAGDAQILQITFNLGSSQYLWF